MSDDPKEKFAEIALRLLSDDVLFSIFRKMEPIDIVNLCTLMRDKCNKFKYWELLSNEFFGTSMNDKYSGFRNMAEYYNSERIFNLNWPTKGEFLDPSKFKLHPTEIETVKKGSHDIVLTLVAPRTNYHVWLVVIWDFESTYAVKVYGNENYDDVIAILFENIYDHAYENVNDTFYVDAQGPQNISTVAEALGYEPLVDAEEFDDLDGQLDTIEKQQEFAFEYFKNEPDPLPKTVEELKALFPKKQGIINLFGNYSVAEVILP